MNQRLDRFTDLVEFLCSPACGGRRTATKENEAARGRIIDELAGIGLRPFEQPIHASRGANVIARLPGVGALGERTILVAAHYDHLGWATRDVAFWGADDNAAGVAILVDTARHLYQGTGEKKSASPSSRAAPRPEVVANGQRQILFVAFDAEEPPFFLGNGMGSNHFVREPVVPLDTIDTMICMDLVGHAVGPPDVPESMRETLFVLGAERSTGTRTIVDRVAAASRGVRPRRLGIDIIPSMSDYHAFELAEIPFLFLTCARWKHYHMVTDTPDKLDYPKCLATADLLANLVTELATRPDQPSYEANTRDDKTTLDTLDTLARDLGRGHQRQPQLLAAIKVLRQGLSPAGALTYGDQQLLARLAGMFEDVLSR